MDHTVANNVIFLFRISNNRFGNPIDNNNNNNADLYYKY